MQERAETRRIIIVRSGEVNGERCLRRLEADLGIEREAAEVILSLRAQVLELQARLRELENELSMQRLGRNAQLAQYREIIYEATWSEADDLGESG